MYITCFLVLMILSQNIVPPSEAKPYFTKIHRLNSASDFDDIVDWTSNQNIEQKQDPKRSWVKSDYQKIRERSITSEVPEVTSKHEEEMIKTSDGTTQSDITDTSGATQKAEVSEMASRSSKEDQKEDKKRSEMEELKDVLDENEDNTEEFGEGISNLYKKMKNKIKKKKCKTCLNTLDEEIPLKLENLDDDDKGRVKYILPYRRSAPLCLLNERSTGGYIQSAAAVPVVQPLLVNAPPVYLQGSPTDDRAALYEVQWLQHSPSSPNMYRKRREIDSLYPKQTYSFMVDRECEHNDKVSEAQKQLVDMIRAVKGEFLKKNNLTFLPILFVPHCDAYNRQEPDSDELGQMTFQNVGNDQYDMPEREKPVRPENNQLPKTLVPSHGKISSSSGINIGRMTIILLANNTFSVVFPGPNIKSPTLPQPESPQTFPQQQSQRLQTQPPTFSPKPEINVPFKRNVMDNLKQYLENAFNFIDIRRVLSDDEVHDRDARDVLKHSGTDVIPGILLYPKRYGPTLAKCSREATHINDGSAMDYYYFTTSTRGASKFKRSLETKKSGITEGDIAAETEQLEIEKKQDQLEKEMQKDMTLEKEVVEALNAGSSSATLASSEEMKKDEEYLEKEHQEMVHNEQLLEGAGDTSDASDGLMGETETIGFFTEPLITEEIELISSATDSMVESMSAEASAVVETGGNPDEAKSSEVEELQATDDAITEPPQECETCIPEEPGEPEPCQTEEECVPPSPHSHIPTSDETGVNQTDLAKGSKVKMSKSIAEFENEMRGIIHGSKKSPASEEKRKGIFDITTKSSGKPTKKRKSKKARCCRTCQRARRDLKATNPSSSSGREEITTSKTVLRESPELVKITVKENISPVALSEEVEDVTEVLFTTKPDQEQMELSNEIKCGGRSSRTTAQKLGEPVTIMITQSTESVATTAEVPSVLSEYIQPPLRDENDEAVTETLTRLLRDLRLVDEVQNILEGIKETGYEIREAVRRRTKRNCQNDEESFSTGRKLFSMEVHQKAAEAKGPFRKFKKRTYRRRSGVGFKRYSRTINENKISSSKDDNVDQQPEDGFNSDQFSFVETPYSKKKRWKDYAGNWVEWIPDFEPFLEPNYQNYQF